MTQTYERPSARLRVGQAAEMLGVSVATANNDWSYAKGWLRLAMLGDESNRHDG